MPFTLAHPAAVVPLSRWGLSLSALAIGSMAPDFEYYLRLTLRTERYWHTLPGALWLALPCAFGVYCVFHAWIKLPLAALLPRRLQARLAPYLEPLRLWPPRRLGLVLLSILAGIATHAGWDLLTHADTWHGIALRGMSWVVLPAFGLNLLLCEALHIASSALGLAVLGWLLLRWLRAGDAGHPVGGLPREALRPAGLAALAASLAGTTALVAGLVTAPPFAGGAALRHFAGRTAVVSVMALAVQVLIFCVYQTARATAQTPLTNATRDDRPRPKRKE